MSLDTFAGSFALNTTTGTQAISGLGFQPKALLLFFSSQIADGSVTGQDYGQGVAVSSSQRAAVSVFNANGGGVSPEQYHTASACILAINAGGTPTVVADLVSMDADGFTINVTTVDGVARIVNFLALGGADLTNVGVKQWQTATTTGNQSVTGVGFTPDCLIDIGTLFSAAPPSSRPTVFQGIGFATSSTNRAESSWKSGISVNEVVESTQRTSLVTQQTNTTVTQAADLVSMDADGFTVNWSTASSIARYHYALCLRGGRYRVGSFNQKTSSGSQAVTGVGFLPSAIYLQSFNNTTSSSILSQNRMSFGAGTGASRRFAFWEGDKNGVGSKVNNMNLDRVNIIKLLTEAASPTVNAAADLTSLDVDGFTLNWSAADATAREIIYLAFGNSLGSSPSLSPSTSSSPSASPSASVSPSVSVSLSPSLSASPSASQSPSSSVSQSPSLSPSPSSSVSLSPSSSVSLSPSRSPSLSSSASISLSPSSSVSLSPSSSASPSSSLSASPSASASPSSSFSPSPSLSQSPSASVSPSPSAPPLATYLIHQYRVLNTNSTDQIEIKINSRSTLAASVSPVYMQIYNVSRHRWDTLDSDSTSAANIDFNLASTISRKMEKYYDNNYEIAVRIWQLV